MAIEVIEKTKEQVLNELFKLIGTNIRSHIFIGNYGDTLIEVYWKPIKNFNQYKVSYFTGNCKDIFIYQIRPFIESELRLNKLKFQ